MHSRRAVVTGGAGFVGAHLCEALLARGISVVCVDNLLTGNARNITHLADRGDFQFLRRDLTEQTRVPGPVGYVFHLASAASPADYLRLPLQTLLVGSAGTLHALQLAEQPADDPAVRRADTTPARRELGWEPRISVRHGLSTTLEWFAREPVLTRSTRSPSADGYQSHESWQTSRQEPHRAQAVG